jgi:hypothetical protein
VYPDPRSHPQPGGWAAPPTGMPTGVPRSPGGMHPAGAAPNDALVNVALYGLFGAVAVVVALPALVVGPLLYLVASGRGWRWWTLVLPGLAVAFGLVGGAWAIAGDPAAIVSWHAVALRELFGPPQGPAIADLVAARWPTWLVHELPLSLAAALLGAGLTLEHIGSTPGHELSFGAQRRRARLADHRVGRARTAATGAPLTAGPNNQPVLGAWIEGDLTGWRAGRWAAIPTSALGLGGILLGVPGAGKTETLLRLAELGLAQGWDVHVIDAKGDAATAARFAALAAAHGHTPRIYPGDPYDGWRGEREVLRNRLGQIVDYTEPFYEDGAGDILDAILTNPAGPPRSFRELITALEAIATGQTEIKGVNRETREGTLSRYRRFAATAAATLDGTWAFEDSRASYLLLDGVTLGKDAPRLARFLVEDFAHYATSRKPPDRRTLLLIDEFSALRLPNAASKFEKVRSFGASIVIAAQSPEGLHDDPRETDRLLNTAGTIIAHRIVDPDPIVQRAGTRKRAERSHQLVDGTTATGAGVLRIQDTYRIDPNDVRSLSTGTAWIIHAGKTAKIAVTRTLAGPREMRLANEASPLPPRAILMTDHVETAGATTGPADTKQVSSPAAQQV